MNQTAEDYNQVLDRVKTLCQSNSFPGLIAIYVAGSVARGDFLPGRSDIDLYAVADHVDPNLQQILADVAVELGSTLTEVARANPQPVGITLTSLAAIEAGQSFLGAGFEYHNFMNTGRRLWGREIRPLLPKPSREQERSDAAAVLSQYRGLFSVPLPEDEDVKAGQIFTALFRTLCILLSGRGVYSSAKAAAVSSFATEFPTSPLIKPLQALLRLWRTWGDGPLSKAELATLEALGKMVGPQLCDLGLG